MRRLSHGDGSARQRKAAQGSARQRDSHVPETPPLEQLCDEQQLRRRFDGAEQRHQVRMVALLHQIHLLQSREPSRKQAGVRHRQSGTERGGGKGEHASKPASMRSVLGEVISGSAFKAHGELPSRRRRPPGTSWPPVLQRLRGTSRRGNSDAL